MYRQSGVVTAPVIHGLDEKVPLTEMLGSDQRLVFKVNGSYELALEGNDSTLAGDDFDYLRHVLPHSQVGQGLMIPNRDDPDNLIELGRITSVRLRGNSLEMKVKKSKRSRPFNVTVRFEGIKINNVREAGYRQGKANSTKGYPGFR